MSADKGSDMIQVTIDGRPVEVAPGTTILAAAKQAGIEIPALCHSPLVEPYGVCRVCSVEIAEGKRRRVVTACNYPLEARLRGLHPQRARAARPPAGARDDAGALAEREGRAGPGARRRRWTAPRFAHPRRNEDPHACILCGLCVRLCHEGVWHNVLAFEGRGESRRVTMPFGEQPGTCVGCMACASICPTGAIRFDRGPEPPGRRRPHPPRRRPCSRARCVVLDKHQCHMREIGTAHLTEIMNDYDLLPVLQLPLRRRPGHRRRSPPTSSRPLFTQGVADGCALGCDMACAKAVDGHVLRTGPDQGKAVLVDGPEYETVSCAGSNLGIFEPWAIIEINYYCDHYGLDTISFGTLMAFVMECYEAGVLNRERTGGLDLSPGSIEGTLEVLHQMARGEGFGLIAGQGVRRMKKIFAERFGADPAFLQDIGMEAKGLEYSGYICKESLAQQGGYGIALKGPQHDEAWLIFMDMVNKQIPTFEDKAEALHYFPMWRTWFGLNGLCKLLWNDVEPEDNADVRRAGQGAGARARLLRVRGGHDRPRGRARGPDPAERARLQLPAHLQPQDGLRPPRARRDPLPRAGPGDRGRVPVAPGALRQAAQGGGRRGPGGDDAGREARGAAALARGPLREAARRRLQAARLDERRHPHAGQGARARHRPGAGRGRAAGGARRDRVSMTITVNGDPHACGEGLTVEGLLREKSYSFPLRVILVNQQVVKREQVPTTVLHDGDVVEVIHLIGGG